MHSRRSPATGPLPTRTDGSIGSALRWRRAADLTPPGSPIWELGFNPPDPGFPSKKLPTRSGASCLSRGVADLADALRAVERFSSPAACEIGSPSLSNCLPKRTRAETIAVLESDGISERALLGALAIKAMAARSTSSSTSSGSSRPCPHPRRGRDHRKPVARRGQHRQAFRHGDQQAGR